MTDRPDQRPPLDSQRLALQLAGVPGLEVELIDAVESTNASVADRARAGAPDGLVIVAEDQRAGRGRLDRSWESVPRAGLTFSMLLRPSPPERSWPWLPLLAGYSIHRTLRSRGFAAGLKWPNDVLIDEHKVAGILVELVDTAAGKAAVVGIGVNVDHTAEELPVPHATSLAIHAIQTSDTLDRTELLSEVLIGLRGTYDAWTVGERETTAGFGDSYAAACVTLGQDVRVDLPVGPPLVGRAARVDHGGQLVVQTSEGAQTVAAGDVTHVRVLPVEPE